MAEFSEERVDSGGGAISVSVFSVNCSVNVGGMKCLSTVRPRWALDNMCVVVAYFVR